MRIPTERDTAYNKFIRNKHLPETEWEFLSLKKAFLESLNSDRLPLIEKFLNDIYIKGQNLTRVNLQQLIVKIFPLHLLLNSTQISNYLFTKLKVKDFGKFYDAVYLYFLDKCSYNYSENDLDSFVFENAECVFRETEISDEGAGKETVELKYKSIDNPKVVLKLERGNGYDNVYVIGGKQISFYKKNVDLIENKLTATKLLTNIWTDISWEGIANEGGVKFKKGKKPERLIKRCFELSTNEGDFVLDSFLGSGTTAAVAHKMKRKYIGIELGEHCNTHCLPRLKIVCDGTDQGGISKIVDWKGGGGFKFYELAPSLLNKDKYNQWVINPNYNAQLLAAAMARHEGFTYCPSESVVWKQGYATENHFIFTTTNTITPDVVEQILSELKPDESLRICCTAFVEGCNDISPRIEIKKIPAVLLGKCEFGKEDYCTDNSIINMPADPDKPAFTPSYVKPEVKPSPAKISKSQPTQTNLLF
jgi:adenine-specific DNA-methyltransferase